MCRMLTPFFCLKTVRCLTGDYLNVRQSEFLDIFWISSSARGFFLSHKPESVRFSLQFLLQSILFRFRYHNRRNPLLNAICRWTTLLSLPSSSELYPAKLLILYPTGNCFFSASGFRMRHIYNPVSSTCSHASGVNAKTFSCG